MGVCVFCVCACVCLGSIDNNERARRLSLPLHPTQKGLSGLRGWHKGAAVALFWKLQAPRRKGERDLERAWFCTVITVR